jgi:hypothetical protein
MTAKNATAYPPFDFAQGKLFGDDSQNGKGKSRSSACGEG